MFPKESAARIQDQQQSLAAAAEEEAAAAAAAAAASRGRGGLREEQQHQSGRYLGTRPSRNQPWRRTSPFHNVSQSGVMATLRTSFQAASELMMPSGREMGGGHDDGRPQQSDPPAWISRETSESAGRRYSRDSMQTQAQATQEQVDAVLAARLQQAELNAASSDAEDLLVIEGSGGGSQHQQAGSRRMTTARPRLDALASAAAAAVNLRSAAHRAPPRQRSRARTRS